MRRASRVTGAALLVAAAGLAAGCGGGGQDPSVVRASWGDPQNPLEPANTTEVQGGKVLDMVFRGLMRYNPRTAVAEPMMARSIRTTDSTHFTVRLKPGWTFSNGEKVTAHSYVDAWNYGAATRNRQQGAPFFSYIDGYDQVHPADEGAKPAATTMRGLRVKDDLTFTVTLNQKFGLWPHTLGYTAFMPLPRAFFTDHAAWLRRPVGNGPYRIESYARGALMKLRTWKDYPGPDRARNGGVDLQVYTDTDTAYTDLLAGNLDVVDDVPATQLKFVAKDLGGRYINQPAGVLQTVAFPLYQKKWGGKGSADVGAACPRRSTGPPSPAASSATPATPPPTGPPRPSGGATGTRRGCAGMPAATTRRRPGRWSPRAAASPANGSRSPTTPTSAPTSSGWTRSATASTSRCGSTSATARRSAPWPTSGPASPAGR